MASMISCCVDCFRHLLSLVDHGDNRMVRETQPSDIAVGILYAIMSSNSRVAEKNFIDRDQIIYRVINLGHLQ